MHERRSNVQRRIIDENAACKIDYLAIGEMESFFFGFILFVNLKCSVQSKS